LALLVCLTFGAYSPAWSQEAFRALRERRPADPSANKLRFDAPVSSVSPRVLLAGDSWAQYMWDDGSHNDIFDKFGQGDKRAISLSLSEDPGPGYTGPEYAISGSKARHWVDTYIYPWIQNVVNALQANPSIDTVVLSIGGNDALAGKPDGGWYKDMDLDVPGSEAAFYQRLQNDTFTIIDAFLAVRPDLRVMLSSYDYPNFNVGFWCFISACPMRRNLSRDPTNDLITDAEINAMLVQIEQLRVAWANSDDRILYDHSLGLMHYYYGDGTSPPFALPHPGQTPPDYAPFPGGNPLLPSLRSAFRWPNGIDADPIHLDYEGYQYKITNQTQARFFQEFRGAVTETFSSVGGLQDGWSDGTGSGTDGVQVGRVDATGIRGILTFDTSSIPEGMTLTGAALYLHRQSAQGTNPFESGLLGPLQLDMVSGSFGAPEVEPGDATAPADVTAAGTAYGSAHANGYAIRVQLDPAALGTLNTMGSTQFRLSFTSIPAGTGTDKIVFADGDASSPIAAPLPTLSDLMGGAAPFLDVTYEIPVAVGDEETAALILSAAGPNPFTQATTLRFDVPGPGAAQVAIYDVAGRRITTLVEGGLPAGPHAVVWDGTTQHGSAAPAGIYWARLCWKDQVRSQRLVRLMR
jgi:hypothetical protein